MCRVEYESLFNEALEKTKEGLDFETEIQLLENVTLAFKDYEMDSGQILVDCVSKYGVEEQWTLVNVDYDYELMDKCEGKSKEFLKTARLKWPHNFLPNIY